MTNKKYLLFSNNQLILSEKNGFFSLPDSSDVINTYFIGNYNDCDCYAADITLLNINTNDTAFPLKLAFQKCNMVWHSAIARSYQIVQWDHNHQFCGKCGKKTVQIDHQFEKHCDTCHLSFFPKLSPAIIVLIKKDDQILMARQKSFPEGVFGLIAGFVEVGESLEDAVHREVHEEVGIRVKNIRYYGSQPWPFPDSLMIGFIADYNDGEINCCDGEIEIAGWYDVDHLPGYPSHTHSIAMRMIEYFVRGMRED